MHASNRVPEIARVVVQSNFNARKCRGTPLCVPSLGDHGGRPYKQIIMKLNHYHRPC